MAGPSLWYFDGREVQREGTSPSMPRARMLGSSTMPVGCLRNEDHGWIWQRDSEMGEATPDIIPGTDWIRLTFSLFFRNLSLNFIYTFLSLVFSDRVPS